MEILKNPIEVLMKTISIHKLQHRDSRDLLDFYDGTHLVRGSETLGLDEATFQPHAEAPQL